MKIAINTIFGGILFEYDCENNDIRKTVVALLEKFKGELISGAS